MVDCHNFTHFFAVSLKVLKSSREQGVLSSGHCSRCSIVCVSVPQSHYGSPVWYPHLIKFALERPMLCLGKKKHTRFETRVPCVTEIAKW